MELRYYLSVLRRRVVLILVTVAVAVAAAWMATPRTSQYLAGATIYVGARQFSLGQSGQASQDVILAIERIENTFSQMIHSEPIAAAALERTHLQRSASSLVGQTNVFPIQNTQLLRVEVTDRSPVDARDLTNAIANAFVEKVQTFEPSAPATQGSVPSLPAYVFEEAGLPTSPQPTGLSRNVALAGLFGFLAAAGITFLLEYLDLTIKTPAEAERRLELPVLGVIPMGRQRPVEAPRRALPVRRSA